MFMKKLMMIAAMMVAALTASAQNDDLKNEFGVYYGFGAASDIFSTFAHVFSFSSDDQHGYWGPIGVEYYYHTSPVVAVGAVASIAGSKWGKDSEDYSSSYITLMPSVKFNWLRKRHFGMYSSLSAGVMFMSHNIDNKYITDKDQRVWFMAQGTPLGMEFGSETFRGFTELGIGEKGFLTAGLRYKW